MGLIALPLSPCALIPYVCELAMAGQEQVGTLVGPADAAEAVTPPVAHSCCAEPLTASDESTSGNSSHNDPESPCPRGCCRVLPVGTTVEKVVAAESTVVTASAPSPLVAADGGWIAPAQEALLPAQTLQSLSCLWRC